MGARADGTTTGLEKIRTQLRTDGNIAGYSDRITVLSVRTLAVSLPGNSHVSSLAPTSTSFAGANTQHIPTAVATYNVNKNDR